MNKIFFEENTSLRTIKKLLLELNARSLTGYKIFLSYQNFLELKKFINYHQLDNYEYWIDITDNLNNNQNLSEVFENGICYYDFGKNPKITNIIKAKNILPSNRTLIVKINLNKNSINDIIKIWNYECDIFIDKDEYSFEQIQNLFVNWKNKRDNFSKKILDFDNLFNNPNNSCYVFKISDDKIFVKNILNNYFLTKQTFKEIEEEVLQQEILCETCSHCPLQGQCKSSLNGYEGLQTLYTEDLSFNCKLTQFLLNSIQQIKEDADEKFNFSRKINQSM